MSAVPTIPGMPANYLVPIDAELTTADAAGAGTQIGGRLTIRGRLGDQHAVLLCYGNEARPAAASQGGSLADCQSADLNPY